MHQILKGKIIMFTNKTSQNIIHTITNIPQQVINYISGAVSRIFSPTKDDYPKTGVQPFEGDPADEKSS
jgi:hypothetical protein